MNCLRKYLTCLFAWIAGGMTFLVQAGNENYAIGARGQAMGNTMVTHQDVFSVYGNQAGLAGLEHPSIGVYGDNRFFVNTLNTGSVAAALPTRTGVFGLNTTYFGFGQYNEKKVGLSFGKSLGERFAAGVQFDWLSTYIEEYGTKNLFTFEVGVQSFITNELTIGAHVYNPIRVQIGQYREERTPAIFKLGLSYQPVEELLLSVETEKDIDFSPRFKGGVEYRPIEQLFLRAGVGTQPLSTHFGAGLAVGPLNIDLATSFHPKLGYTPHISIRYRFEQWFTDEGDSGSGKKEE